MKESSKQTGKYWSGSTLIALALILLGVFIAIVTFLTVIGPILGLVLAGIGVYLLVKGSRTAADAPSSPTPRDPHNIAPPK